MKTAVSTQVLIQGLVRSPDREGALAHLDPERGFAFVARGAMSFSDVIDPTIWVKEKLSLALTAHGDSEEPPLRRAIAMLRTTHAELMARPERERTWISVLLVLITDGEGMALIAGDCPCYRFRAGVLSRLGRNVSVEGSAPPSGSLGSEAQVKLEMIPLLPHVGDCYILSTHSLREGELSMLARDLTTARDLGALLRTASTGSPENGRVAIAIRSGTAVDAGAIAPMEADLARRPAGSTPAAAWPPAPTGSAARILSDEQEEPEEIAPLELEPIEPAEEAGRLDAPLPVLEMPEAAAGEEMVGPFRAQREGVEEGIGAPVESGLETNGAARAERREAAGSPGPDTADEEPAPIGTHPAGLPMWPSYGGFGERRPWYEWIALWGGGALAIVALALLIRAILPGILGTPRAKVQQAALPLGSGGNLDLFSDPPGAAVKIDGVPIAARTPATDVSVAPGRHRVEMDWGVYGTRVDSVIVAPGGRVALRPRLLGSVGFRSSDPARVLDVYVDGAYVGSTPVVLESLVVGRHLIRFGGPGLNTSAQEVEVLQGTHVDLTGNAGTPPPKGRVTIRSALLSDTGFEAGRGDPIWADSEMRGVTPATIELGPGTHSFRVVRRGFPPQITVLDVKPGGDQFITAEFGAHSEEPLRFTPPSSVSIANPLPLTIALPEGEGDQSMVLWLYAAPPGGTFQPRRMTQIDEASKSYAALLPPEVLRNAARQVKLYFKGVGAAGRELYSEIYTVPVKN
ncbi:MAG TPA: PEGA domain-containing protein [Candidatus Eisenbacteria bacterium]